MSIKDGEYHLNPELLQRRVKVAVIGTGGSGSHVIAQLAVLNQTMLDLGHPGGIFATAFDRDLVSEANIGRAKFFLADKGVNKATAIINRVNMCFGLDWDAVDLEVTEGCDERAVCGADLIIGCVDTRQSRRAIKSVIERNQFGRPTLWMDLGNGEWDGQVVLGEGGTKRWDRLPCVTDLYPEMLDPTQDPEDGGPSCSRAEALMKQSAFVNATCALHAVSMLGTLFRFGKIGHSAVFFDVKKSRSSPLLCTTQAWAQFGWKPRARKKAVLKVA